MEDQLNDLTELHQHEMADLKQELASVEERVAYQAQERARDIQVWNHTMMVDLIFITFHHDLTSGAAAVCLTV